MKNLKYIEILEQNKKLGEKCSGESYEITVLSYPL